jgi:O-succinylbenzoic acid--CoA ligase
MASRLGLKGFGITPLEASAQESAARLAEFIHDLEAGRPVVFYTSGSTGPPRIVEFEPKAIRRAAEASIEAFSLTSAQGPLLCVLPPHTVASRMMAVRALLLNRPLWVMKPALSPDLSCVPDTDGYTQISLSPAQLAALMKKGETSALQKSGSLLLGGSPVPKTLEDALKGLNWPVSITYGMTETLSHVAFRRPGEVWYKALHPGISFSLTDKGCLVISTPWNEHPVVTTDMAELSDVRTMRWLGRADFVINSGGVKIHPEQLESLLATALPTGLSFFIAPMPHPDFGQVPVLCVEGKVPNLAWEQIFSEVLPSRLTWPRRLVSLTAFVRAPEGKFLRADTLHLLGQVLNGR